MIVCSQCRHFLLKSSVCSCLPPLALTMVDIQLLPLSGYCRAVDEWGCRKKALLYMTNMTKEILVRMQYSNGTCEQLTFSFMTCGQKWDFFVSLEDSVVHGPMGLKLEIISVTPEPVSISNLITCSTCMAWLCQSCTKAL